MRRIYIFLASRISGAVFFSESPVASQYGGIYNALHRYQFLLKKAKQHIRLLD
jgi:hypothetical protein